MLRLRDAGIQMSGRWLVRGITLAIRPGRVTALVGPNGSGKSTVLRLLAGIWRPSEGVADLDRVPLGKLRRRAVARKVAFVPQDTHIDAGFRVRDIVAMGRYPHMGRFDPPNGDDVEAIQAALLRANVSHLASRPVNQISGGERQRVLIARGLAARAEVILLDEPISNLDVDHSLDTLGLLRDLAAEGRSIGVAMHDINSVARWADRAALLQAGRLRACGPVEEVLTDRNLEAVFGVRVERLRADTGSSALVFHAARESAPGST